MSAVATPGGSYLYTIPSTAVVAHGSDAFVARPDGVNCVIWLGSVTPTFGVVGSDFRDLAKTIPVVEWVPSMLPGVLWWNPRDDASITLAAGLVSAWTVQGGSLQFTQGSTSRQPLPATIGGAQCFDCTGSKCVDLTSGVPDGEALTMMIVAQSTVNNYPANVTQNIFTAAYTSGAGAASATMLTIAKYYAAEFSFQVARADGSIIESLMGSDEGRHVFCLDRRAGEMEGFVDDRSTYAYVGTSASPAGMVRFRVGALASTFSAVLKGNVGDVIIAPGGLSRAQITACATYLARHNGLALQPLPKKINVGPAVQRYNAWPRIAKAGDKVTVAACWSTRLEHSNGSGGGALVSVTRDRGKSWSNPIDLATLIPAGPLDDISPLGMGSDGAGGLLCSCWNQKWVNPPPDTTRDQQGPHRMFHCPATLVPYAQYLSSWSIVATFAYLDAFDWPPTQITSPIYVPGFGGPGDDRLIAFCHSDALRKVGYIWAHPNNLAAWHMVTLFTGVDATYCNEWSPVHVGGGRVMSLGHRFVSYDQASGPFPLQVMTYDPAVGIDAAGWTAAVDTNLNATAFGPGGFAVDDDFAHIEAWTFSRITARLSSYRATVASVFATPTGWPAPTTRFPVSGDIGKNMGYPDAVRVLNGTLVVCYAGHEKQGTGNDVPVQTNIAAEFYAD